ncbi:MAG TPA: class I SAM-dependent methyltransferase [Candidatus Limnocylindria bacterium]|nr:class I SAM-dependent methyltransferase [Candidatus Limnocylindria bacterium]
MSGDIFAGQLTDSDLLAQLYDLEHDEVTEDLIFYREQTRRSGPVVLDLGCGSGRLLRSYAAGKGRTLVGVDASAALLRRAKARIAAEPLLAAAREQGRLHLLLGDVRRLDQLPLRELLRPRGADLVVAAGVMPHLDGPDDAVSMLSGVKQLMAADGRLILDDLGPDLLPDRDLPLSVDWRRQLDGQPVVRRSQLQRRESPEGLRVGFSTIVDLGRPDGTIARLPASFRLWYSWDDALAAVVREAGLAIELAYGSHDLDPYTESSERRITVVRHAGR